MRSIGEQVPCHVGARCLEAPVSLLTEDVGYPMIQVAMDEMYGAGDAFVHKDRTCEPRRVGHHQRAGSGLCSRSPSAPDLGARANSSASIAPCAKAITAV